jgi:hypothetical protein
MAGQVKSALNERKLTILKKCLRIKSIFYLLAYLLKIINLDNVLYQKVRGNTCFGGVFVSSTPAQVNIDIPSLPPLPAPDYQLPAHSDYGQCMLRKFTVPFSSWSPRFHMRPKPPGYALSCSHPEYGLYKS